MSELAILVPVLHRPHRVKPLLDSIHKATPKARVLFILDAGDDAEEQALNDAVPGQTIEPFRSSGRLGQLRVDALIHTGNYATKINVGVQHTDEPLLFLAADDLEFAPDWFEIASSCLGAGTQVVGVNDLCSERVRAGNHATHFLMTREYARRPCAGGGRGPLCEDYDHSYVDDELFGTAQRRGVLAVASNAVVRHLHPDAGLAEIDEVYVKGRARMRQDRRIFRSRRRLWT